MFPISDNIRFIVFMVVFLEVSEMLSLWRDLLNLIFPSFLDCPLCGGKKEERILQ